MISYSYRALDGGTRWCLEWRCGLDKRMGYELICGGQVYCIFMGFELIETLLVYVLRFTLLFGGDLSHGEYLMVVSDWCSTPARLCGQWRATNKYGHTMGLVGLTSFDLEAYDFDDFCPSISYLCFSIQRCRPYPTIPHAAI